MQEMVVFKDYLEPVPGNRPGTAFPKVQIAGSGSKHTLVCIIALSPPCYADYY